MPVQLLRRVIDDDHDDECDHGAEHADGSRIGEHAVLNAVAERIGGQDVGVIPRQVIAEQEVLVEARVQNAAKRQNQQNDNGWFQVGQGDVPDLLKTVGAVDFGRFIELLVDGRDGCQIHNRAVSHILPRIAERDDPPEVLAVLQE